MRPDPVTFLALGDSYTIGEGVETEARWPTQLAERLRETGCPVAGPQVVARTGWTTEDLLAGLGAARVRGPFHLVSLQIGVNDQYRGRSPKAYRNRFRILLERATALAGDDPGGLVVLSIPDWSVTPFAEGRDLPRIASEIDRFNAVNREESLGWGASYVDVTEIGRIAGVDASLLAADGLHPSGSLYGRWVRELLPVVRRRLDLGGRDEPPSSSDRGI